MCSESTLIFERKGILYVNEKEAKENERNFAKQQPEFLWEGLQPLFDTALFSADFRISGSFVFGDFPERVRVFFYDYPKPDIHLDEGGYGDV